MNTVLNHTACPECRKNGRDRSGDNLGVYSDHVFCFSCGYRAQKGSFTRRSVQTPSKISGTRSILPDDATLCLDPCAYNWLDQYITRKEVTDNRLMWSDKGFPYKDGYYHTCLIFPVFSTDGEIVLTQARHFGHDESLPKYLTKGNPNEVLHILGNGSGPIVLVEDLISAIKVSRVCRAMPLFGSDLSLSTASRLASVTNSIVFWLDKDKTKHAHRLATRYSGIFDSTSVISTDADPKKTDPSLYIC